MLFLVCFTRLVMRCFLCRPGLLLCECLTVCRSPLCCMNTRPLGRGCTTLGCWWGAGCPAVSGTGILAADWLVPLRMSGGASVDFVHLSEPHVCVVVADRCSWQLFVAVGGTPSSASVNLPPLFCEACLFILCAFTVVVIVTADRSYIPKWSSTPKKCLKVITM